MNELTHRIGSLLLQWNSLIGLYIEKFDGEEFGVYIIFRGIVSSTTSSFRFDERPGTKIRPEQFYIYSFQEIMKIISLKVPPKCLLEISIGELVVQWFLLTGCILARQLFNCTHNLSISLIEYL